MATECYLCLCNKRLLDFIRTPCLVMASHIKKHSGAHSLQAMCHTSCTACVPCCVVYLRGADTALGSSNHAHFRATDESWCPSLPYKARCDQKAARNRNVKPSYEYNCTWVDPPLCLKSKNQCIHVFLLLTTLKLFDNVRKGAPCCVDARNDKRNNYLSPQFRNKFTTDLLSIIVL